VDVLESRVLWLLSLMYTSWLLFGRDAYFACVEGGDDAAALGVSFVCFVLLLLEVIMWSIVSKPQALIVRTRAIFVCMNGNMNGNMHERQHVGWHTIPLVVCLLAGKLPMDVR
jgi:hypothetical protein